MTIKDSYGERLFHTANMLFLIALSLVFLIPVWMVFATSFMSEGESIRRGASYVLLPHALDLAAYKLLFLKGSVVISGYKITLFRVIVGTLLNLLCTVTFAYGLARRTLPGRNLIVTLVFFTMIFSGGLIPSYLLMNALHLKNSIWVLVLPGLISTWNMFIMRNFLMTIPEELEESAIIDGGNAAAILLRIILPLSLPAIATIGLFYAVGHWNEWFSASIYINDVHKQPIQVLLRNMLLTGVVQNDMTDNMSQLPPPETLKSAMIVVSTLPILCVYPFIQKYFVKGALMGSVKG
jgi:putative aldouronate transport system permease protein